MATRPYFAGTIGETIAPGDFPAANYLIDDTRYSYEGHWAFCRFDGDEVYGARLGFGRGAFDARDYGAPAPLDRSNLWVHLELMTRDGALLWIGTGRYVAEQVQLDRRWVDCRLEKIFRITGWPTMDWHFCSDDGEAEVAMRLELQKVTILPDCVMPSNRFAMWLAIACASGEVRFRDKRVKVAGTAFYDHPRINVVKNDVPPFGWYLYTPIRFADGSHLAGYYCRDGNGRPVKDYCFGVYVSPAGKATWVTATDFRDIKLDADGKPSAWVSQWTGEDFSVELQATVKPTGILKAWGGPAVAQTRKENGNIPLVFDCRGEIAGRMVSGGGLAEFIVRAGHAPKFP
jgi:hypothetical protein